MFDLDFILKALSILVPVCWSSSSVGQQGAAGYNLHHLGLHRNQVISDGHQDHSLSRWSLYGPDNRDIKTDEYIPTNDFINVMVDAVAKVRVADDDGRMKLAMRNT